MSCDTLTSDLSKASQPAAGMSITARPASGGFCRTFSFAPPVVIPAGQIITFAGDFVTTFASDNLFTF